MLSNIQQTADSKCGVVSVSKQQQQQLRKGSLSVQTHGAPL
jgi:hypothetical protein